MNNARTFAVVYPFGTSNSYKLFPTVQEACDFLDEESNRTNIILPDSSLTLVELAGSVQEVEDAIFDIREDQDAEDYIAENAVESEEVNHWRLDEVWAERLADGRLVYRGNVLDDNKPTPDEDGGEVIEAWSDGNEIYDNLGEAVGMNKPSQYLTKF